MVYIAPLPQQAAGRSRVSGQQQDDQAVQADSRSRSKVATGASASRKQLQSQQLNKQPERGRVAGKAGSSSRAQKPKQGRKQKYAEEQEPDPQQLLGKPLGTSWCYVILSCPAHTTCCLSFIRLLLRQVDSMLLVVIYMGACVLGAQLISCSSTATTDMPCCAACSLSSSAGLASPATGAPSPADTAAAAQHT